MDYIDVPRNCISSRLPICPMCGDTKCVEITQQAIKLSIDPSYRTECKKCNIYWESYKTRYVMNATKQEALEAAGWKFGDASDFLGHEII